MMVTDEDNQISLEEVNRVLLDIENKYSALQCSPAQTVFEENLAVLSKEFDSVGVQPIDLTQSMSKIFKQIVSSSRALVQMHRRTLTQMKETNINIQTKNSNSNYLRKVVDDCHTQINSFQDQKGLLQNKILILENKVIEHKKREIELKNEMEKVKKYSNSKNNEYSRHIKKLSDENRRLKESLRIDVHTPHSSDEIFLKFIKKYKRNEEIYKNTIHKLKQNNEQLLEDIIDLKSKLNLKNT